MNRLVLKAGGCALAFVIAAACAGPGGVTGANSAASPAPNAASPETPAPAQGAGKSFTYNFDGDAPGQVPAKFHAALTGQGTAGVWEVRADPALGGGL